MTPEEQVQDRKNWNEAMQRRETLITRAIGLGLILKNPDNRRMVELEDMVEKAERWRHVHHT